MFEQPALSAAHTAAYAELHCHSYFSLLDGSSSPEDLVARAEALGLKALALTDHDSLAGAVRFWTAARRAGLHVLFGAEVTLADETHLTLLAETQEGYGNLCKLITAARMDQGDNCQLSMVEWSIVNCSRPFAIDHSPLHHSTFLLARQSRSFSLLGAAGGAQHGLDCPDRLPARPGGGAAAARDTETAQHALDRLREVFGPDRLFVELQHHALPDDDRLVRRLIALARRRGLPTVATHNVHYATRDCSMLRDALIAVRRNESLAAARRAGRLPLNSNYALASPAEMARRFAHCPDALANTVAIAERCQVALDFSQPPPARIRWNTDEHG